VSKAQPTEVEKGVRVARAWQHS